ncbi:hypothetical protein B0H14DRAFT_3467909 [Mycena olivaceomarginata]|nr:hypothetical protein B0H14DRAFT_3467909 [Mycena olivaceomarginata]
MRGPPRYPVVRAAAVLSCARELLPPTLPGLTAGRRASAAVTPTVVARVRAAIQIRRGGPAKQLPQFTVMPHPTPCAVLRAHIPAPRSAHPNNAKR